MPKLAYSVKHGCRIALSEIDRAYPTVTFVCAWAADRWLKQIPDMKRIAWNVAVVATK